MIIPFERDPISKLILVEIIIDDWHRLTLALDTAATNTTIDIKALRFSGFQLSMKTGDVELETANGIVVASIYQVSSPALFGVEHRPFQIQAYDFIDDDGESEYHGVLGLDFLKEENSAST